MATAYTALNDLTVTPTADRVGYCLTARSRYSLTGALVINDTIDMVTIPAGHFVTDMVLVSDDLDTHGTPTITLDVGIKGATADTFFAASTVAQGGGVARPTLATAFRDVATTADRVVQLKVKAAPATGATTGTVTLLVSYRSK